MRAMLVPSWEFLRWNEGEGSAPRLYGRRWRTLYRRTTEARADPAPAGRPVPVTPPGGASRAAGAPNPGTDGRRPRPRARPGPPPGDRARVAVAQRAGHPTPGRGARHRCRSRRADRDRAGSRTPGGLDRRPPAPLPCRGAWRATSSATAPRWAGVSMPATASTVPGTACRRSSRRSTYPAGRGGGRPRRIAGIAVAVLPSGVRFFIGGVALLVITAIGDADRDLGPRGRADPRGGGAVRGRRRAAHRPPPPGGALGRSVVDPGRRRQAGGVVPALPHARRGVRGGRGRNPLRPGRPAARAGLGRQGVRSDAEQHQGDELREVVHGGRLLRVRPERDRRLLRVRPARARRLVPLVPRRRSTPCR